MAARRNTAAAACVASASLWANVKIPLGSAAQRMALRSPHACTPTAETTHLVPSTLHKTCVQPGEVCPQKRVGREYVHHSWMDGCILFHMRIDAPVCDLEGVILCDCHMYYYI